MKKITAGILFLLIFLSGIRISHAQITWEKLFVQINTDAFRSVQEVPGGGYIAAGYTSKWSPNDTDAFVVRIDEYGDTLWTRTYNFGKKDLFYKVINTSDGGFVFCGYSSSFSALGDDDAWYMKLDANGNQLWHDTYGGTAKDRGQDIVQTSDGGYAMTGYTYVNVAQGYNSFLLKIDASGGQTWNMKYGGSNYDDSNTLKELPSGDFIMAGQTISGGTGDIWLVKTNSSGGMIWNQTIGYSTSNENAEHLLLAQGGGFIICGSSDSSGTASDDDGYLVKTDDAGDLHWSKRYGGDWPDDFHRIESTLDGGYIMTGTTQSNTSVISNIWFFKTDASGDSTWSKVYGGANHDHGYSGLQTSDGGYILAGYTASYGYNYEDAIVIKTDGSGNIFNHLFYTTVTALVAPVNNSCGSANASVTITIRNFGDTAVSSIPSVVEITGAITQTLNQTFLTNLSPPNFANFTFSTTINTLAGGTFNFYCYTDNDNDVYPAMNYFTVSLNINGTPVAPTTVNDTNCGPGSLTLTATTPSGTIDWFTAPTGGISQGTGGTFNTPVISTTTTYYAQASTACGTTARTPAYAVINPVTSPPTVFPAGRCGPGTVTLLASGPNIQWYDTIGNLVGTGNSYTTVFITATTTYYATSGIACPSAPVPVVATVNPLPVAGFTISDNGSVCLGDAFQFTNTTTGATNFFWDFGDASGTSNQTDPAYTYASIGIYYVVMIAVDANSCSDTIIDTVAVTNSPQVSFAASGTSGCAPFSVTFTNNTTNGSTYLWNFGDGFSSADVNPVHDYLMAGNFTVTLLATTGSCSDSDSVVNMITVFSPPVFDFGADTLSTNAVTLQLDAGAGYNSYEWNNGSTTQTIIADTNGIYCVIVSDMNSCSDTDCVYVIVDAMAVSNLTDDAGFIIYPNPVEYEMNIQNPGGVEKSLVNVYDETGRLVFSAGYEGTRVRINTSVWKRGFYSLEIISQGKMMRKKLVVI